MMARVAVTSPSFSTHPVLRQELLAAFPEARFNDGGSRLAGDRLVHFIGDAEAVVIGLEKVDGALFDACPSLRVVAKYGVGLDNIDQEECQRRGIGICWVPGVNRRSVAELVLCFMLGLCRNVFRTHTLLREGQWVKDGGVQLSGRTVGIVGLGNTGREIARLLEPLHCRVLGNDIADMTDYCRENGIEPVDKKTLFAEADLISLHVPLTPETNGLVDAARLSTMKPSAYLINACRGEVVEQAALKQALMQGVIAGAALDVFEIEPPADREFLTLPNLISTAHIGGNADEAILAMGRSAIRGLRDALPA